MYNNKKKHLATERSLLELTSPQAEETKICSTLFNYINVPTVRCQLSEDRGELSGANCLGGEFSGIRFL